MSGWHSPDVAFDPNHAPMADPPMIRFTAPEIGPAPYHVKRKIGTAAENRGMPGPQHRAQQPNDTRNRAKSTDVAVYPLTAPMCSGMAHVFMSPPAASTLCSAGA